MSRNAAQKTLVRTIVIASIGISVATSFLAVGLPDGNILMGAAILNGLIGVGVLFRDRGYELVARSLGGSRRARRVGSPV